MTTWVGFAVVKSGTRMPSRRQSYTVLLGTPESRDVRSAVYRPAHDGARRRSSCVRLGFVRRTLCDSFLAGVGDLRDLLTVPQSTRAAPPSEASVVGQFDWAACRIIVKDDP